MFWWPTLSIYDSFKSSGRLSTRFRRVFMGISDHSSGRAFARSDIDVGVLVHSLSSKSSQKKCSKVEFKALYSAGTFFHTRLIIFFLFRLSSKLYHKVIIINV
ncbi:hypothetical protein AMECASPLE_030138 [Ameca splendens]|uniref:Uncharacterized protein n=1 Tax=Ameca splendens TaxID=208324 RepID=A0ABV0Y660_9TELE